MDNFHTKRKPDTRNIIAANKARDALKLKAQGLTYEEIAKKVGYSSKSSCFKAIQREMDRVVVDDVNHLRNEEANTLDTLHRQLWEMLEQNKGHMKLYVIDRLLHIIDLRCKLFGLYKHTAEVTSAK